LLIESLSRHYDKLTELNLAKNKLGHEGAKFLAEAIKSMKMLSTLDLAENEIGDQGIAEIIRSVKDFSMLEHLDISGNGIGKSSHGMECADVLNEYLNNNRYLE
jgi:Ran GTPase-activating protein (RanGAP) involved in mRNA processing and transport